MMFSSPISHESLSMQVYNKSCLDLKHNSQDTNLMQIQPDRKILAPDSWPTKCTSCRALVGQGGTLYHALTSELVIRLPNLCAASFLVLSLPALLLNAAVRPIVV